jgi:methyltransferase
LGKRVAVALPDTLLEERGSLREKTVKLGYVARACSIFGVDLVQVYRDEGGRGEPRLIRKVLEYLETPQYLRRRLFPMDDELRYAGLLPPLRIPSHKPKVTLEELRIGAVREGVANRDGTVDIGLDEMFTLAGRAQPDHRVTVQVESVDPPRASAVGKGGQHEYWGYAVEEGTLSEVLADGRFSLKLGTSRFGSDLKVALPELQAAVRSADSVSLVFGAPSRGLFDMVGPRLPERLGFVLNLFPEQHVQTVRTEEALLVGLGLLGSLSV